jgi:hypothetical protein
LFSPPVPARGGAAGGGGGGPRQREKGRNEGAKRKEEQAYNICILRRGEDGMGWEKGTGRRVG